MDQDIIKIFDREKKVLIEEKVYGGKAINFLYKNSVGLTFASLLAYDWWSDLYGWYQNTSWSASSIPKFVEDFHIPMHEFKGGPYNSFNDFFIRSFKEGARTFVVDKDRLAAFAEGRYFAYSAVTDSLKVPVKGKYLQADQLLQSEKWAKVFKGGPMMIARLCPLDYHRFHFPDDGKVIDHYRIEGNYHSVNPVALKAKPDIFLKNERQVTILETKNFGTLAYIEVGALSVGKIIQSYTGTEFKKGQEKGYFLFGGSTVILLGMPGRWTPDADLLEKTNSGVETLIRLGSAIAQESVGKK